MLWIEAWCAQRFADIVAKRGRNVCFLGRACFERMFFGNTNFFAENRLIFVFCLRRVDFPSGWIGGSGHGCFFSAQGFMPICPDFLLFFRLDFRCLQYHFLLILWRFRTVISPFIRRYRYQNRSVVLRLICFVVEWMDFRVKCL